MLEYYRGTPDERQPLFSDLFWNFSLHYHQLVQFSPLTDWVMGGGGEEGGTGGMIQQGSFKYFLQEALVSSSGMGRDVHSLMLSIQHFLCRPQHRPASKVP